MQLLHPCAYSPADTVEHLQPGMVWVGLYGAQEMDHKP